MEIGDRLIGKEAKSGSAGYSSEGFLQVVKSKPSTLFSAAVGPTKLWGQKRFQMMDWLLQLPGIYRNYLSN